MTRPVARRLLAARSTCSPLRRGPATADYWTARRPRPPAARSDRARPRLRHQVLGAEPRPAVDRPARANDGAGWHRLSTVYRRAPTGGSPGRARSTSGRSATRPSASPTSTPTRCATARSATSPAGQRPRPSYAQADRHPGRVRQPMSAAACLAPDDCWFGGDRLPATAPNRARSTSIWMAGRRPGAADDRARQLDPGPRPRGRRPRRPPGRVLRERVGRRLPADGEAADRPYALHQTIYGGDPPAFVPLFPDVRHRLRRRLGEQAQRVPALQRRGRPLGRRRHGRPRHRDAGQHHAVAVRQQLRRRRWR